MADESEEKLTPAQKSKRTKQNKKTMAAALKEMLYIDLDETHIADEMPPEVMEYMHRIGVDNVPIGVMSWQTIYRGMLTGDVDILKFIRDTIGEKPSDQLEIGGMLDKPIAALDMSKLTDDELRALIAHRTDIIESQIKDELS